MLGFVPQPNLQLQRGDSSKEAIIYAFYGVLFKFPQVIGQTKYWLNVNLL